MTFCRFGRETPAYSMTVWKIEMAGKTAFGWIEFLILKSLDTERLSNLFVWNFAGHETLDAKDNPP